MKRRRKSVLPAGERPPKPPSFPAAKRAGVATARYLPADPKLWLQHCAAAGIVVCANPKGLVLLYDQLGPDREQAVFLEEWLQSTPGGWNAVLSFLLGTEKKCWPPSGYAL